MFLLNLFLRVLPLLRFAALAADPSVRRQPLYLFPYLLPFRGNKFAFGCRKRDVKIAIQELMRCPEQEIGEEPFEIHQSRMNPARDIGIVRTHQCIAEIPSILDSGFVEMTQPGSPRSPTQRYRLTAEGRCADV